MVRRRRGWGPGGSDGNGWALPNSAAARAVGVGMSGTTIGVFGTVGLTARARRAASWWLVSGMVFLVMIVVMTAVMAPASRRPAPRGWR